MAIRETRRSTFDISGGGKRGSPLVDVSSMDGLARILPRAVDHRRNRRDHLLDGVRLRINRELVC